MSDTDPLIVPVTVDALAVTDAVRERGGRGFRRWVPEFKLLYYNATPEPAPFTNDSNWNDDKSRQWLGDGIVVRWQVPAGLRRGRARTEGGRTEFPLVPNRWLVVRHIAQQPGQVAAWVVESDYLDPREGTSAFVHPVRPGEWDPEKTPFRSTVIATRIGRHRDIGPAGQAWSEPAATTPSRGDLFLTAVGPGLMTFSVYEPYHRDVFSLHDPLTHTDPATGTQTPIDTAEVGYQVIGWYSDPAQEELHRLLKAGQNIQEALDGLGWSLTGTPETWSPASTLYCGRLAAVGWDRNATTQPESDIPNKSQIAVAIGSSADEAAAAKPGIAGHVAGDDAAHLLHMFAAGHLDTLDGPDGDILAAQNTHRSWFEQSPGGFVWRLAPTQGDGSVSRRPQDVTWSAAPAGAETLLAELNTLQSRHDENERELRALQQRLYTLWWMHGLPLLPPQYTRDQFYREITPTPAGSSKNSGGQDTQCEILADEVARRHLQLQGLTDQITQQAAKLTQKYQAEAAAWELRREALPSFWRQSDPTVVLGHTKSGHPHPAPAGEPLVCRTRKQLLGDGTLPSEFSSLKLAQLPALVPALLSEFAHLLSHAGDKSIPPDLVCPTWRQPWKPLLFQWKSHYWHVPHTETGTGIDTWNWVFDGGHYAWKNGRPDPARERGDIVGRRFLVPLPQHTLAAQAARYAADSPVGDGATEAENRLAAAFTAFAESVSQTDLLSQKLDGLTDALACRDKAPNLSPPGRIGELVGDSFDHLPHPGPKPAPFQGWQPSGFTQIRAGQIAVTALSIVDEFGQSLDVLLEKDAAYLRPLIADSLKPQDLFASEDHKSHDRIVQLPPRLLQPARLRFDFVSQQNKKQDVDLTGTTTPVGAWIIPNYVDRALLCYASRGEPLGELRLQLVPDGASTRPVVAWAPLPDSAARTLADLATDHPVLHSFAEELTGKGPKALTDLLSTISKALNGIDPGSPYGDDVLGTLLGRPLALARARMGIELEGPPAADPGWEHALDWQALTQWRARVAAGHGTPPAEMSHLAHHWPVRLGNAGQLGDGLIGYFTEPNQTAATTDTATTDYKTFYAVTTPDHPGTGYVREISQENWHRLPADSTTHTYLTVLFDPQAAVHATTDLLPVTPLQLPGRFTRVALATLQTALRLSPVLTTPRTIPDPTKHTTTTAPAFITALSLPHPTAAQGTWDWCELQLPATGQDHATWHSEQLVQIDQTARLDEDHPTIRTGFLRLSGGFPD